MPLREDSIHEYETRILGVLKYINENLDKDLSLSKLSEVACFSQFHFHRLFNSLLGETPGDYVKRLRVEKAANMLITNKSMPVTHIAHDCGFSSSAVFARVFKEHFNFNAGEWRKFGFLHYSLTLKANSKNCKSDSKNSKESLNEENYFNPVNSFTFYTNWVNEMKVEIKNIPVMHIAFVVHHEGYNNKIGKAFDKLCRWAGPKGYINNKTVFLGISLDNPDITPPDKCRYYASMTVPAEVKEGKGIGVMDIPELKCAVYRFRGFESEIEPAYRLVFGTWLPQSGYQPADFPSFEIYISNPDKDPEKKFTTDIYIPVKPL